MFAYQKTNHQHAVSRRNNAYNNEGGNLSRRNEMKAGTCPYTKRYIKRKQDLYLLSRRNNSIKNGGGNVSRRNEMKAGMCPDAMKWNRD